MRELTRFRREFNECYSLRSKFIMTKTISMDITEILKLNKNVLKQEKDIQDHFFKKKNELMYRRQGTAGRIKSGQEQVMNRHQEIINMSKHVRS